MVITNGTITGLLYLSEIFKSEVLVFTVNLCPGIIIYHDNVRPRVVRIVSSFSVTIMSK